MFLVSPFSNLQLEDSGEWLGKLMFGPGGAATVTEGGNNTPDQDHSSKIVSAHSAASDNSQSTLQQVTVRQETSAGLTSSTASPSVSLKSSPSSLVLSMANDPASRSSTLGTTSLGQQTIATSPTSENYQATPAPTITDTGSLAISKTSPQLHATDVVNHPITSSLAATIVTTSDTSPAPTTVTASAIGQMTTEITSLTYTATPTSSSASSTSTHHIVASSQNTQKYVGIAFGTIAGIAILIALISWAIRMRSRKKSDWSQWSWSPFGPTREEDEGTAGFMWGQTTAINIFRPQPVSESAEKLPKGPSDRSSPNSFRRPPSAERPSPPIQNQDLTCNLPSPFENPFKDPDFVTTSRDATGQCETAEVASERGDVVVKTNSIISASPPVSGLGPLQVTNFMPGDHSSSGGEESSPRLPVDFNIPLKPPARRPPRYSGASGRGLDDPKHSPPPSFTTVTNDVAPPNPTQSRAQDPFTPGTESWARSIRNNLTNALAAVASRTFSTLPPPVASNEDRLTPLPIRRSIRQRRVYDVEWQESSDGFGETSKTSEFEEKADHAACGRTPIYVAPGLACIEVDGINPTGYVLSETESAAYTGCDVVKKFPRLPYANPTTRGSSIASDSSQEEKVREGAARALENIRERAATRGGRPQLLARATSLLSYISSDADEERWTDDEKRARKMLLERRKKNMSSNSVPASTASGKTRGLNSLRSSVKSVRRTGANIKSKCRV